MSAPWLWRIGFPLVRAIALAVFPTRVEGIERLPRSGGYILVANHVSWYDPAAIEMALNIPLRYMAKREVFATPIIGALLRLVGHFPVRRGESDRNAMKEALRVVQIGAPLGFFPEGTRSKDGRLRRAKPGIAFLARRSGAPLVPVGISGTRPLRFGSASRIAVHVGKPFTLADLPEAERRTDEALADAIMARVAALLPAEMRGEYALARPGDG